MELNHDTKHLYERAGYDVVTNCDGSLTHVVREGRDRHLCAACLAEGWEYKTAEWQMCNGNPIVDQARYVAKVKALGRQVAELGHYPCCCFAKPLVDADYSAIERRILGIGIGRDGSTTTATGRLVDGVLYLDSVTTLPGAVKVEKEETLTLEQARKAWDLDRGVEYRKLDGVWEECHIEPNGSFAYRRTPGKPELTPEPERILTLAEAAAAWDLDEGVQYRIPGAAWCDCSIRPDSGTQRLGSFQYRRTPGKPEVKTDTPDHIESLRHKLYLAEALLTERTRLSEDLITRYNQKIREVDDLTEQRDNMTRARDVNHQALVAERKAHEETKARAADQAEILDSVRWDRDRLRGREKDLCEQLAAERKAHEETKARAAQLEQALFPTITVKVSL